MVIAMYHGEIPHTLVLHGGSIKYDKQDKVKKWVQGIQTYSSQHSKARWVGVSMEICQDVWGAPK